MSFRNPPFFPLNFSFLTFVSRTLLLVAMAWAVTAGIVVSEAVEHKAEVAKERLVSETLARKVERLYNVRIEGAKIWGQVSEDDIVACASLLSSLDQQILEKKIDFFTLHKRVESINGDGNGMVMLGMEWIVHFGRDSKGGWKILRHGLWNR